MNFFKRYIAYLKDNPEGYWFKRKLYGWGWAPARPQGWAVVVIWLVVIIGLSLTIDENSPPNELVFTFFLPLVLLTITLIRICYKKGEAPKWMSGLPKENKGENNLHPRLES